MAWEAGGPTTSTAPTTDNLGISPDWSQQSRKFYRDSVANVLCNISLLYEGPRPNRANFR